MNTEEEANYAGEKFKLQKKYNSCILQSDYYIISYEANCYDKSVIRLLHVTKLIKDQNLIEFNEKIIK